MHRKENFRADLHIDMFLSMIYDISNEHVQAKILRF